MLRIVAAQLRYRAGRSLALLIGIVAAVTSFTVLTGTTRVSRLEVVGAVERNFRNAYDILVRPQGARTDLEAERGLVRRNFLSSLGGGISLDEYEAVRDVPGVEVAAPIAVLGYQGHGVDVPVPLDAHLDASAPRQVFRITSALETEGGLTRVPGEVHYAYVTTGRLDERVEPSRHRPGGNWLQPVETLPDGRQVPVCPELRVPEAVFDRSGAVFGCYSPNDARERPEGLVHGEPRVRWPVSFVLAAVDPEQEARLAGLEGAVVEGRYLRPGDGPREGTTAGGTIQTRTIPVLVSSDLLVDERLEVVVERLPPEAAAEVIAGRDPSELERALAAAPGAEIDRFAVDTSYAHGQVLDRMQALEGSEVVYRLPARWAAGPVDYEAAGDGLSPRAVDLPEDAWVGADGDPFAGLDVPWAAEDTGFRPVERHAPPPPDPSGDEVVPTVTPVGRFDPARLPAWSGLSALPLEAYAPPAVEGWDARSQRLLGGAALHPSTSPAGYLAPPPLMLTTLSSLDVLADPDLFSGADAARPISAIRVRVAGVAGPDAESRERIRLAAEEIAARTGLDVDITIGSSPTPVRIDLPGGRFGRPDLSLREAWVDKGVAVAILEAADRKSVVLFGLILVVCSLTLANAAAAAVRARRTELGVLACVGWSPGALYRAMLGEILVIGVAAGAVAALLSPAVAAAVDVDVPASRAAVAMAAAIVLALVAGAWPAWRAARSEPAAAVRPPVAAAHRTGQPSGVAGLAATNLRRVPGRTVLGALSLALGTCALTLVLAATFAFREALVGTLLGEAISVRIRAADQVAAAAVLALGALAVADVLYLGVRERAPELAVLRAMGWTDDHVARLVMWEGALLGLAGSVAGAAAGVAGAAAFAGGVTGVLWLVAAGSIVAGTGLAAVAALGPARLSRRAPLGAALVEE
ncbi:MAG TPA: FtsX-like permease family protein [Acidimicrobiales bacterium]